MSEILNSNPESIDELIAAMDEDAYKSIQTAIEIGKWKDGKRLSSEQLEHCLQILILYEARYFSDEAQTVMNLPSCLSKTK